MTRRIVRAVTFDSHGACHIEFITPDTGMWLVQQLYVPEVPETADTIEEIRGAAERAVNVGLAAMSDPPASLLDVLDELVDDGPGPYDEPT